MDAGGRAPHWAQVMVPILDCTNHPSRLSLERAGEPGKRFMRHAESPRQGCIQFTPDWSTGELRVRAPKGLPLMPGDEVYNFYGQPSSGSVEETAFIAQFGFSPCD